MTAAARRLAGTPLTLDPVRDVAQPGNRAGRPNGRHRQRFGRNAIGHAAAALDRKRSVPDVFRVLAEKDLGKHEG